MSSRRRQQLGSAEAGGKLHINCLDVCGVRSLLFVGILPFWDFNPSVESAGSEETCLIQDG